MKTLIVLFLNWKQVKHCFIFIFIIPFFGQTNATVLTTTISASQADCCNGDNSGWAITTPNGGTMPYTYVWSPSGGTDSIGRCLTAGTYTVVVTDFVGNTASASVTISQPPLFIATFISSSNNTSCINPNGSANVMMSGGMPPYTYIWLPSGETRDSLTGLAAGTYTFNVTDNNCCIALGSPIIVTIGGTTGPMVTINTTPDTNSCDGMVNATVIGGSSPYTYKWSPGGQTNANVSGLCFGTYCCKVNDHSGCMDSDCVYVDSIRMAGCTCNSNCITTGVIQINKGVFNISVFPNPSTGIFTLQLSGVETQNFASLQIFNVLGEMVYSTPNLLPPNGGSASFSYPMNISSQPNGIYFYRVLNEDATMVGSGKMLLEK